MLSQAKLFFLLSLSRSFCRIVTNMEDEPHLSVLVAGKAPSQEMIFIEVSAVIPYLFNIPVKALLITIFDGDFNVIEPSLSAVYIVRSIHVGVHMEDKLAVRIVIIVESGVIHVKHHFESLLSILIQHLRGLLVVVYLQRRGRYGVLLVK